MGQQGTYPLNGRVPTATDTATGVVTGATADIPLGDIAGLVPIATATTVGTVKPDNTTITVATDGTLTATSGAGTVTSVGLTAPAQFAVAGSPVTTSGTLAVTWEDQTANEVLAGPASGADAAPTFRSLVSADLPLGTDSVPGALQPDGTTITVTDGVISAVGGGSGSVTSVGLTMPAQFTIAGSPVTTSGTLAVTWNTETAHTFLSGPSSGSAAAPTFRTIAAADLPVATTGALGAVQPDGTTITVSSGVISAVGSGGTVSSVGLTLPAIFTVSGSPVTTSGTLSAILANENANTVFAGPVSGGAAGPTFRALVTADMPSSVATSGANSNITSLTGLTTPLTVAQGGMGAGTHTAHGVLIGEGTSAVAATSAGTAGQVLTSGGASADPAWGNPGQPYFQATASATQSLSGTVATVTFDTVVFDSGGYFNTTSHAFTPLVAGKYLVHVNLGISGTVSAAALEAVYLTKNATIIAAGQGVTTITTTGPRTFQISRIVQMNGATDTIIAQASSAATSPASSANVTVTFFEAYYIGP